YVHRADARSLAFFRDAVLSQAEELTHLGYNHPSVVTYAVHADPPWSHSLKWLGERHTEQLNRDVDEEAAALLRSLDPSRPVLPGRPVSAPEVRPLWRRADFAARRWFSRDQHRTPGSRAPSEARLSQRC